MISKPRLYSKTLSKIYMNILGKLDFIKIKNFSFEGCYYRKTSLRLTMHVSDNRLI
jgi:hypothetical protein